MALVSALALPWDSGSCPAPLRFAPITMAESDGSLPYSLQSPGHETGNDRTRRRGAEAAGGEPRCPPTSTEEAAATGWSSQAPHSQDQDRVSLGVGVWGQEGLKAPQAPGSRSL